MGAISASNKDTENHAILVAITSLQETLAQVQKSQSVTESLARVHAYPVALSWLSDLFTDGKHLLAYELSDGRRSTREIARQIGVDQKTISTWWRAWQRGSHIVEKAGNRGQFRAKFTLAELVAIHGKPPATTSSA